MKNPNELITERQKIYGDYTSGVSSRGKILDALKEHYKYTHGFEMDNFQVIWLTDLIIKLARASMTPEHTDSLLDLSNYALLIKDSIEQLEERKAQKNDN